MQTIEHIMCAILAADGDLEYVKSHLGALLLPDAIRMYTKNREYSHFEQKAGDPSEYSYMRFPSDMKSITAESVAALLEKDSHLVQHPPCVIGENTLVDKFAAHNPYLPMDMIDGIRMHLNQDVCFDIFVREIINCEERYEDVFILKDDSVINGKAVRDYIADVESQLAFVLAHMIHERYGLTINQAWFDHNVLPVLLDVYPEEMANNTYKYMKFRPDIDNAITKNDWSGLDLNVCLLSPWAFQHFCQQTIDATRISDDAAESL